MGISKRTAPIVAGVLLLGQVARAEADTLPTAGVGAGLLWERTDQRVYLVADLFLGMDVRAQDPVPGLQYPAFVARAHLLLGGTNRFEPRAYLVTHPISWDAVLSGKEERTAFGLGVGPSIPLGSDKKMSLGFFAQATAANLLTFELGVRAFSGPLDFSASAQFDIGLGLFMLVEAMHR